MSESPLRAPGSFLATRPGLLTGLLLPALVVTLAACGTASTAGAPAGAAGSGALVRGPGGAATAPDGDPDATAIEPPTYPNGLPNPYMTHRDWGTLPAGRAWGRVSGVGVDPEGKTIWAFERCGGDSCVDSDDPTVLRFLTDGTLVASFGADMFLRPHGMFVDPQGNVWVADGRGPTEAEIERDPSAARKGNQVVKFSPEGQILMVLGRPGATGSPPDALNQPNDVIVAPNGEVLVAEGHSANGANRISRFSSDGRFLGTIGEPGSGPGQFSVPHALAFDSQGRLFVADRGNNRLQIFDRNYRFVEEWRQFGRPNDVFIGADDTLYVIDAESGDDRNPGLRRGIYIGSARTGQLTAFIPGHNDIRPPLGTMGEGIVVDSLGNIFAGEVSLNGMTMFMRR